MLGHLPVSLAIVSTNFPVPSERIVAGSPENEIEFKTRDTYRRV